MPYTKLLPCLAAIVLISACGAGDTVAADTANAAPHSVGEKSESKSTAVAESILKNAPSGIYGLDKSHAYINFSFSHLGFSNPTLGFRDFDLELDLDKENLANSELKVSISVDSIDSRVPKFDKHLVGDDMFDTAKFPTATFIATNFEMTSADTLHVTGDLTIKDVTRSVVLDTKINKAANHPMRKVPTIGISASTTIKRSDFGISYAVPNVGDTVIITIEAELPQAK